MWQCQLVLLVVDFEQWFCGECVFLLKYVKVVKVIDYLLLVNYWLGFMWFFKDGWVCFLNNVVECFLCGVVFGWKSWFFVGLECGGQCVVVMYILIGMVKFNDIDFQVWFVDVIVSIFDMFVLCLYELFLWNWKLIGKMESVVKVVQLWYLLYVYLVV